MAWFYDLVVIVFLLVLLFAGLLLFRVGALGGFGGLCWRIWSVLAVLGLGCLLGF